MAGNDSTLWVSDTFKTKVDSYLGHGKKHVADKKEDYEALQTLLSGCKNSDEEIYLTIKMKEYEDVYKLDDLRSRASEYIRVTVDSIKARFKPKKSINDDDKKSEARSLIEQLRYAVEENRTEDVEYIREELYRAGFKDLLDEFDAENKKPVSDTKKEETVEQKSVQENTGTEPEGEATSAPGPQIGDTETAPVPSTEKPKSKSAPRRIPKTGAEEPSKTVEPEHKKSKIVINEDARITGDAAADKAAEAMKGYNFGLGIVKQMNYVSNSEVEKACKKVNSKNAYTFFKAFRTETGKSFISELKRHHVPTNCALPALEALLEQARQVPELQQSEAFKNLSKEVEGIKYFKENNKEHSATPKLASYVTKLCTEMSKYLQLD